MLNQFSTKEKNGRRRIGAANLGCLIVLILLSMALPALADGDPNDLLALPAVKSDLAPASILMDVVDTGDRLVAVGERGHILYSENQGKTWSQATVPTSITLTAVEFPTPGQGWAVGHDSVVLHSSDGGKTWEKQLDGYSVNKIMLAAAKELYETKKAEADAGAEFPEYYLEDLEYLVKDAETAVEEGPTRAFMDVWFKNEREGIVVGVFGLILRTTDGGASWEPILESIDNPDGYHYYGIARSGDSLFIAGERGMIFRSDDDGRSWERLDSPYEGSFFGVAASPDGHSIIVYGLRGNAFRSTDGGRSWQAAKLPKRVALQGGTITVDGTAWLIGSDGSLFRSDDGGVSFAAAPVPVPGGISIVKPDGGLVIVGLRGVKRIPGSDLTI